MRTNVHPTPRPESATGQSGSPCRCGVGTHGIVSLGCHPRKPAANGAEAEASECSHTPEGRGRRRGSRGAESGYALLIVMVFTTVSLLVLAAALNWSTTNSKLNDRNNEYFTSMAAAEAATEKVVANLTRDYQDQGESLVWASLNNYRVLRPTVSENPAWSQYLFTDAQGGNNRTFVERLSAASYIPLQSQYAGLYGLASSYRVISNARQSGTPYDITAAVKQDLQLASIPIFQFAIFYTVDLEINPGPDMDVTGRVHGNANINIQPVNHLNFQSHVTAAGNIIHNKHTNDPTVRNLSNSSITYEGEHDANTSALNLPIGTNNSPAAVQAIIQVPPGGEDPNSPLGKQRFHNKADLVILVSNSTVTVKSGQFNNFATTVPYGEWNVFLKTNVSFTNARENKTIKASELDIAKFRAWSATNATLWSALGGRDTRSIYIADLRSQTSGTEAGVRVKNGDTLPSLGLTVATPNPLYVQGHYNAPSAHRGTTNTSLTKPAALIGDAINILSSAWNDNNSANALSSRGAGDTTVNAALLGGIVPSNGTTYSGGVENFPRFLENWSGRTLAYNGSMVVMFYSSTATAPWGGNDVYSPPNRQWTFDLNFLDATKLPPGTPEARALIRGEWAALRPGTVL